MWPGYLIRVLGPVDVATPEGATRIGGIRTQALLGTLVIGFRRTVPSDYLIAVLWGEDPPASAMNSLQSYVCRLRRILGADTIRTEGGGYLLDVGPEEVDALRFERLIREAANARDDPTRCRDLCRQAFDLWRGAPFGELADDDPFRLEALRLDELRMSAMEIQLAADLALGHHELVVGTLEAEVEEYPYRENLWRLLIQALVAEGRRVEALRACSKLRRLLAEAGLEPDVRLQEIEDRILASGNPHPFLVHNTGV